MVRAKARGLDQTRVLDLGIYIIISALIGAKLLLLLTNFRSFIDNPRELISLVWSGGVFYGGLILAVVVALVYIRRIGLPLWTTCDVFAPGIALGPHHRTLRLLLRRMLLRQADQPVRGASRSRIRSRRSTSARR